MDNNTHVRFDMGHVMNRLRSIAEDESAEPTSQINDDNFTTVMSRLASIKGALPDDKFSAMRAGVRSLYMNQRPNPAQLMALTNLLEIVLRYVAEDNSLFQRLKSDLNAGAKPEPNTGPNAQPEEPDAEPESSEPENNQTAPAMRGLK